MFSRRTVLTGLAASAVTGCGGRQQQAATSAYPIAPRPPERSSLGLDAVIDISHQVTVSDFRQVRQSGILAVIHKATEGGDYLDKSCASRRPEAEAAGLLWGVYHFGTKQYSGERQATFFLSSTRPGPKTLMALDLELNDPNPRNTMTLQQGEAFVRTVANATGRLPVVYVHPNWANGQFLPRTGARLGSAITPDSILARCDLWVADYHDTPEVPYAWQGTGWKLWQYAADENASNPAYGAQSTVAGISHCDRNVFNGDQAALNRFWGASTTRA
jgi:lysozyme